MSNTKLVGLLAQALAENKELLAEIIAATKTDDIVSDEEDESESQEPTMPAKKSRGRPRKQESDSEFIMSKTKTKLPSRQSHIRRGIHPKFIDDLTVNPELIDINAKIKAVRKEPDRRPKVKKIQVRCHVCGKTERVSPDLAPIRYERGISSLYRCNSCI